MPPITVRVTLNWVFRLMAMPKSQSFSLMWAKSVKSSSMPSMTMPALLTSTSMRPWQRDRLGHGLLHLVHLREVGGVRRDGEALLAQLLGAVVDPR